MTEYTPPPKVFDDRPLTPVPGHINNVTGSFCTREGGLAPGGRCPDGCDHADHYSNDGHPECEEIPGASDLPAGYRWADEDECERIAAGEGGMGHIVVPRTVDSTGRPYTQGEADVAVPKTR